jgi:hypothetical protein
MTVRLIYVPENVLDDRLFLRDFFANYAKIPEKSIVLHACPKSANLEKIRFLSKRFSSNLSEAMIPNAPFSGDQRGLMQQTETGIALRHELLTTMLTNLQCIVLNTIITDSTGKATIAPAGDVLQAIIHQLAGSYAVVLPHNPLSALGNKLHPLYTPADVNTLLGVYPEESPTFALLTSILPAAVAGVHSFYSPFNPKAVV